MTTLATRLDVVPEKRDELVAEIDERHPRRLPAQPQLREESTPELERLVDAADVERDMVDADRARHHASGAAA